MRQRQALRDTPRGPSGAPRQDAALPDAPRPAAALPDAPGPDARTRRSAAVSDQHRRGAAGGTRRACCAILVAGVDRHRERGRAVPEPTALSGPNRRSLQRPPGLVGQPGRGHAAGPGRGGDRPGRRVARSPARGPFSPLTEFVSGALLLVRRAICSRYVDGCAAAATTSGTDCGAGDGIPRLGGQLPTSPWDPNGLPPTTPGMSNGNSATWGSTLLRASKDVPMELDPGALRDDGVRDGQELR